MNYNELLCSIESHYNKEQFDISYSLALEAFARNRLNRTALYYLASSCFNLHRFLEFCNKNLFSPIYFSFNQLSISI